MDVQTGKPAISGSLPQDVAAVGVPLDCNDRLVAEDEVGEQAPSGAGE